MANNTIQNPVGIDEVIQRVQTDFYDEITQQWQSNNIEGFGRIYKNVNGQGQVIPEWYDNSTQDYTEVNYNDSTDLQFMFLTPDTDTSTDGLVFNSVVKIVILANLSRLYPSRTSRSDGEFQRDIVSILRSISVGKFEVRNIERTIAVIFNGYFTENINFTDIDPKHSFAVNLNLAYYLSDKC